MCDVNQLADGLRPSGPLHAFTAGAGSSALAGNGGEYRGRSPAGTDCTHSNVSPSATVNNALAIVGTLAFFAK